MTNATNDAAGFVGGFTEQAKTERSKFLTQVLGSAFSATFKAVKPAAAKADTPVNVQLSHAA